MIASDPPGRSAIPVDPRPSPSPQSGLDRGGALSARPSAARAGGYTLVELFLTVGVLMMLLGLIINLDNRLRADSLERRTRWQLQQLTAAMTRYVAEHGGRPPDVWPLVDPAASAAPSAAALGAAAVRNADDVRRCLHWPAVATPADDPLRDPWGTPIAFLPRQNPLIGMTSGDQPFFVSGGPDRQFLTRADNLYSYDYAGDATTAPPPRAGR